MIPGMTLYSKIWLFVVIVSNSKPCTLETLVYHIAYTLYKVRELKHRCHLRASSHGQLRETFLHTFSDPFQRKILLRVKYDLPRNSL